MPVLCEHPLALHGRLPSEDSSWLSLHIRFRSVISVLDPLMPKASAELQHLPLSCMEQMETKNVKELGQIKET